MSRRDPEFEALLDETPPDVEEEALHKDDPENPVEIVMIADEVVEAPEKPCSHRHGRLQTRRAFRKARRRAERRADQYGISEENRQWFVVRHTRDRKRCSCYSCGNQRRHFGLKPIQEKRIDESDEVDEMGGPLTDIEVELVQFFSEF